MAVFNSYIKNNFSMFLVDNIFTELFKGIQQRTDELVVRNGILINSNSGGYVLNDYNFIHSVSDLSTFEKQHILRMNLSAPHPDIVADSLELLASINKIDMDKMRFTGLINGMLSVCKTVEDFQEIFDDMFRQLIIIFDVKFNSNLSTKSSKKHTISNYDLDYANEFKLTFKTQYDRYRFLTEIVGI